MGEFGLVVSFFERTTSVAGRSSEIEHYHEGPEGVRALVAGLKEDAERDGGSVTVEEHRSGTPSGMHFQFPTVISSLLTETTIIFGSAAALLVFIRNLVGTAKDLNDLRKSGTVKVLLDRKLLTVAEGDDIGELVRRNSTTPPSDAPT